MSPLESSRAQAVRGMRTVATGMLLMMAAGVMNVIWMAGLTALVLLEKTLPQPESVVYGSGAGLIAAGLLLMTGG